MPLKWSPPQSKKLTKGGSDALLSSNSSLTSNTSNATKSTATNNIRQYDDDNFLQLKQQQQHNSTPLKLGYTKFPLKRPTTTDCGTSSSMQSLCSMNSTKIADVKREKNDDYDLLPKLGHHFHNNHHHTHSHIFGRSGGSSASSSEICNGSNRFGGTMSKRGKKQIWGSRERAGMSFLIVIAFFAVFGLIVLMEVSTNKI